MGEGPYAQLMPDSALKALFFGNAGAQQAVGPEHISDIGVYYDPYSPPAQQAQGMSQKPLPYDLFIALGIRPGPPSNAGCY